MNEKPAIEVMNESLGINGLGLDVVTCGGIYSGAKKGLSITFVGNWHAFVKTAYAFFSLPSLHII